MDTNESVKNIIVQLPISDQDKETLLHDLETGDEEDIKQKISSILKKLHLN